MKNIHTCPKCARRLDGAFVRPTKSDATSRVLANGSAWLESRATSEVVGDCPRCGIVRKVLFSVPSMVRVG